MRGKRLNTIDIGIMRIDITASCRSRVLRSRSARPAASCWYSAASTPLLFCASMAWVMTSSPTRLISWSTFSTDTRSVRRLERGGRRLVGLGARRGRRGGRGGRRRGRQRRAAACAAVARGAGRARGVVEEAVARVGWSALRRPAARRARRRGSRSPGPAAAGAPASRGTWKVNRSSRSLSLLVVVTLKRRMPSAGLAAVQRLDRAQAGDLLEQLDQVVGLAGSSSGPDAQLEHARAVGGRLAAGAPAGAAAGAGAASRAPARCRRAAPSWCRRRPARGCGTAARWCRARRRRCPGGGPAARAARRRTASSTSTIGGVGCSSWRRSLSSSVSIWCVSSATSVKPKVAAPPLTECAQRKIALSSSSSAAVDVELEQLLLHAVEVLAGFLEEDLVELAQVDAGDRCWRCRWSSRPSVVLLRISSVRVARFSGSPCRSPRSAWPGRRA